MISANIFFDWAGLCVVNLGQLFHLLDEWTMEYIIYISALSSAWVKSQLELGLFFRVSIIFNKMLETLNFELLLQRPWLINFDLSNFVLGFVHFCLVFNPFVPKTHKNTIQGYLQYNSAYLCVFGYFYVLNGPKMMSI